MTAAELAEQLELMTYGVGAQTPDGTFPLPDKMPTFAPAALLRQAAARLRSMEEALKDSSDAIDFFDKVKAASRDEQNAVGTDHWDWLEKAARKARAALSNAGGL
mgnify:FL=1